MKRPSKMVCVKGDQNSSYINIVDGYKYKLLSNINYCV